MRQVRVVGKNLVPTDWWDLNSDSMYAFVSANISKWRDEGCSPEDIRFEFRKKPNIFTRIKEWWKNE